jgi:hypothetical protein
MSTKHPTRPQVYATHHMLRDRAFLYGTTVATCVLIVCALLLAAHLDNRLDAKDAQQADRKAGQQEGYAQAIADVGPTVASAWQQGYLAGQSAGSCNQGRREAPL